MNRMLTAGSFGGVPAGASEPLGSQMVEGVLVDRSRTKTTIAAGQIGNERPIDIVSENWFSPLLKAVVLSRHMDPRFGETTYRRSNLVLGEPDPSLFQVPAAYTIVDAASPGAVFFERRIR